MQQETILTRRAGRVGILQLNRPAQRNAFNDELMDALGAGLLELDADPGIGCILLTGNEKYFAAGADLAEILPKSYADVVRENFVSRNWETILQVRKPVIAAVAGYALGGGCELAMMCDFIIAADNARFGQPEIMLALIPGAGGTQRLPRAISKALAMDMVLTGRVIDAQEALQAGLVSRVVPADKLEEQAMAAATTIAGLSLPSVLAAKECVNRAFETTLAEGLLYERRTFHSLFATTDRKEGMAAFLGKRKASFLHE